MTAAPGVEHGLTDDQLRTTHVEVRWEVTSRYRVPTTLLELLQGLDINEEDWRNEDGTCRFTSIDDALAWARKDGLNGYWAEDYLGGIENPSDLHDSEVDVWSTQILLQPTERS